jgi:hypothetical protein
LTLKGKRYRINIHNNIEICQKGGISLSQT